MSRGQAPRLPVLVHDVLAEAAHQFPDRLALVGPSRPLTYAELTRASDGIATWFQRLGVARGDRVAVMMENSVDLVTTLFGVLKSGAAYVAVNPTTKQDELAYVLSDCGVRVLVADARIASVVNPAVAAQPGPIDMVWAGAAPDGGPSTVELASVAATPGSPSDPFLIDADLAAILYTSGSTGRPKGVMLTHRNVHHSIWSIATYLDLGPDDVIAGVLQMSFGYGLFQALLAARVGATLLVERSFAYPYDVMSRLAEHRVTVVPGVPTIFATMLQMAPFDGLDLTSVRTLTNAAAAIPPAHIRRLQEVFPNAAFFSMYGQTECTRISYLDPRLLDEKIDSVGKAIPNTEVYIVDPSGRRLGPGEVGELVVRGAGVMRGYWGKPIETAQRLREGELPGEKVLYTGDEFRMDDEGFLYFVGRQDDVFKCRGEKVSPKEVEDVIFELEEVLEVAVVGVPDPIDGTAVKALLVVRPGTDLDARVVRRHCQQRLQSHMVPRFFETRDALPKTDSGKIRRVALR
jgi:amino acid adenylation domain-containing protein